MKIYLPVGFDQNLTRILPKIDYGLKKDDFLKTLEEKSIFLDKALKNNYLLFMEHDAANELISLKKTEKGVRFKESYKFDSYF